MKNMYTLHSYETPTVMKHGLGITQYLAEEVRQLNIKKPLIVTDRGIAACGILDKIIAPLSDAQISYAVFDGVEINPPVRIVEAGTCAYRQNNCDGLIAVGGGSPMDTAKAIGVEIAENGSILDYECAEGKKPLSKRIPPLICMPTTAGTGSEVTLWSVITDEKRKYKFNVGGAQIGAHVAFIDPLLQLSLPGDITAGTGMDALCHAIECYTSSYSQPITDSLALSAIELAGKYLGRAVAYGEDVEARYQMAMCAMMAGLTYGLESAGAIHALTQTLGGIYPVNHGTAVAATMVPVMEYNWLGEPEKYCRIAEALGTDTRGLSQRDGALAAVEAVKTLAGDIGIPNLKQMGIKEEDIPMLAQEAFNDPQTTGNPRNLTAKDYEKIYHRSLTIKY